MLESSFKEPSKPGDVFDEFLWTTFRHFCEFFVHIIAFHKLDFLELSV